MNNEEIMKTNEMEEAINEAESTPTYDGTVIDTVDAESNPTAAVAALCIAGLGVLAAIARKPAERAIAWGRAKKKERKMAEFRAIIEAIEAEDKALADFANNGLTKDEDEIDNENNYEEVPTE